MVTLVIWLRSRAVCPFIRHVQVLALSRSLCWIENFDTSCTDKSPARERSLITAVEHLAERLDDPVPRAGAGSL